MPHDISAAVLPDYDRPFEVRTVQLDDPRPNEVLVKLVATGVCGTDLGVQAGHTPFPLPGVLGHEGAGVVEAVGAGVSTVKPGDKVLLSFTSCGVCRNCKLGHPAFCQYFLTLNLIGGRRADGSYTLHEGGEPVNGHFFGQSSFATHALADERGVTRVSDDADLAALAPLGCGIQTGAGTVLNILKPAPGTTIAVFGAGAVGLAAVMAARLTSVERIVVVDIVQSRLDLAATLGATHPINSRDLDLTQVLLDLTDGWGIDYAVDATGNVPVIHSAILALAPLGELALVGAPPVGHTVDLDVNFMLSGRRVIGVTEGDSTPQLLIPALIELIAQGRFPLDKLITPFDFSNINDAMSALKDGSALKPVLHFA
ncbi:NAD(P)-dependent alcohol dehydrogenase [Agromyces protaetiae]|uniref:NAD(P)-dependent alcohol dehydrogenase n=1 Tax=Agromyces protaetiae TaxID=2509455 RepID=A0A4P6FE87_9MICO|nr:NAD(P)-dependent alcohol dehydrogenase [Agromyces protaetiae]QAY74225.1 NAD(P)-dependent alcohol dehydrogenase [Agromyces protaetiae]